MRAGRTSGFLRTITTGNTATTCARSVRCKATIRAAGYLVLPPDLLGPFLTLRIAMDRYPPTMEQAVLADFFREGHFERHVRHSRAMYLERRDALLFAARRHLAGLLEMQPTEAGFQLLGRLPDGISDLEAQARAAEHDVRVTPVSGFYFERPVRNRLLLGFAAIIAGVERLAQALGSLRPARRFVPAQTSISPRR